MLTKQEIEHIAKLARIEFNDDDIELMRKDLSSIIDYFGKLKEVDVENIQPSTHSVDVKNVVRKDSSKKPDLNLAKSLVEAAPNKENKYIRSRPIF